MRIRTGCSHATLESNDISELKRVALEKEEQINYIIKNKTGRPRKYPVRQTLKKPKDPDYFKKYYQRVTKPKEQAERNDKLKSLTLEIENIKTILQKTSLASDLRVEHT